MVYTWATEQWKKRNVFNSAQNLWYCDVNMSSVQKELLHPEVANVYVF